MKRGIAGLLTAAMIACSLVTPAMADEVWEEADRSVVCEETTGDASGSGAQAYEAAEGDAGEAAAPESGAETSEASESGADLIAADEETDLAAETEEVSEVDRSEAQDEDTEDESAFVDAQDVSALVPVDEYAWILEEALAQAWMGLEEDEAAISPENANSAVVNMAVLVADLKGRSGNYFNSDITVTSGGAGSIIAQVKYYAKGASGSSFSDRNYLSFLEVQTLSNGDRVEISFDYDTDSRSVIDSRAFFAYYQNYDDEGYDGPFFYAVTPLTTAYSGSTSFSVFSVGNDMGWSSAQNYISSNSISTYFAEAFNAFDYNIYREVRVSLKDIGFSSYSSNYYVSKETGTNAIYSFVRRLYAVCLNRRPDDDGLYDWANKLYQGKVNGVTAAYGFIFSNEFKNKNLCNKDYVKYLYMAFLGRNADSEGLSTWVSALESGKTREEVFNGFALSSEFTQLCKDYGITRGPAITVPTYGTTPKGKCAVCGEQDGVTAFVKRLYTTCLNRDADSSGLATWCGALWDHKKSGAQVAYGFVFSSEFTGKHYSNTEYVKHLYQAFFGRSADSAGLASWVSKLNNGTSRASVFYGFVGSQEFIKLCAKYGIKAS